MKQYRNKIIMGLALGFGVVAVTMLLSDVNQLAAQAVTFPWAIMLPVLVLRVLNWGLRFVKWHFYLGVVGVRELRRKDSAAVFVSGFVLALSPGKVAEVLKAVVIKSLTGTPVARTLPVVGAERLSDGVAVLILLALSIGMLAADEYWPVVFGALGAIGLLVLVLQYRRLCFWLLDRAAALPVIRRLAGPLRDFYTSSYEIVRWKNLGVAVGLGTLANLLDGVGVYLILVGLGKAATLATFFEALLVISLSVVVGSLSALPGGLGAADFSIGMTMRAVVGLDPAAAGFATLLARFVQLWWGVLVGMGVGFACRRRLLTPDVEATLSAPGLVQDSLPAGR
ncbi:MAG: flippase-like domain-containing protein [Anaerolineae bacterium]|nr:flippase-like domain-containing protein [Anaerolineae bacterium]